jgi:hypothetical protein
MLEELLIHGSVHAYSRVQARPTTSRTPYLVKADMLCLRYMDTLRMSVCQSLANFNSGTGIILSIPRCRTHASVLPPSRNVTYRAQASSIREGALLRSESSKILLPK